MDTKTYEDFIRTRITELRLQKGVSEHRMSLDLDKSGSYIRGISNGLSLPSVRELLNIMAYFNITPADFLCPSSPKIRNWTSCLTGFAGWMMRSWTRSMSSSIL